MEITYDVKVEESFDGMVEKLKEMSEEEQMNFMLLLRGYQAGVKMAKILEKKETTSSE